MPDTFNGPPKQMQPKKIITDDGKYLLDSLEKKIKENEILKTQNEILSQEKGIDELTGLLNKESLQAKIIELKHDVRHTAINEVTFAYLDLDNIKPINDQFGHMVGDAYIKNFAQLFRTFFREHDYIYRINGTTGDEFGVLIESNQFELISKKLTEFQEQYPSYSFSFGIKCGTRDKAGDLDLEEIIHQADMQMIEQKNTKKGNGVK